VDEITLVLLIIKMFKIIDDVLYEIVNISKKKKNNVYNPLEPTTVYGNEKNMYNTFQKHL